MHGDSEGKEDALDGLRNSLMIKKEACKILLKTEQSLDRGDNYEILPEKLRSINCIQSLISGFKFWVQNTRNFFITGIAKKYGERRRENSRIA